MARHFEVLLTGAVATPDKPVWQLPLETEQEQERLATQWNATAHEVDLSRSLVEMFETQAARNADKVAFSYEGASMSYAELRRCANQMAHHLASRGVAPGTLVGVCMERSLDLVVALLGVLKAGAVYLPLDPGYPQERLGYMLAHAKTPVLVTRTALAQQLPLQDIEVVRVDDQREMIAAQSEADPGLRVGTDALVYVMYTSGSTGTPKGIAAAQRQVLNRLAWMWDTYPFETGEVCCQKTAVSFVDSLWELLGPLLKGVPAVIVSDEVVRDPHALVEVLSEQQVSRLWVVPSLLRMILDNVPELSVKLPLLQFWVSSGEALPVELLQRFQQTLPEAVLYNLYGTSEVWDATWHKTSAWDSERLTVPIGTPIANVQTHVLDKHAQPVPVGVPGELYVSGWGLAEGYLHQEALTQRHFVRLAILPESAGLAYRTGDLVRYLPSGDLEYLGRMDQQLKVRGYRVEPGEVEAVLAQHHQIKQVVVVQEADVTDRLIAYIVPEPQASPTTNELRRWLLSKLPDYMVPSAFVIVDTFPLTPSGKIDRRILQFSDSTRTDLEQDYEPPRSETEQQLVKIWSGILKIDRIGIQDNFFDIGGHSLMATQVVSRVRTTFNVDFALHKFFESPTIKGLAALLESVVQDGARPSTPTITRVARDKYRVRLES
jgi:amino acid adenylation domain-containing protein